MQRRFDILTERVPAGGSIETVVNLSWDNPRDFWIEEELNPGAFSIASAELVGTRFVVKARRNTKTPGEIRLALVYSCETDEQHEQPAVDFLKSWQDVLNLDAEELQ